MRCTIPWMVFALVFAGCATVKTARPEPEKVEPTIAVQPGPAAEGQGTVTIDVVDGNAKTHLIISEMESHAHSTYYGSGAIGFGYLPYTYPAPYAPYYRGGHYYDGIYPGGFAYWPGYGVTDAHGLQTRYLCETPCRVNLPYGSYRLQLRLGQNRKKVDNDGTVIVGEKESVFRRAMTLTDEKPGMQFAGAMFTALGWVGAAALAPGIANNVYNINRAGAISGTIVLVGAGVAGIVMLVKGRTVITPGSQVQWVRDNPIEPVVVPPASQSPVPAVPETKQP